ncbi:hypothetical protein PO909_014484, partial [Leuciscus waleckii]
CSISGSETSEAISRYPGESVFLSCSVKCSARFKPDKFIWKLPNYREINQTTNSNELNRLFQGRIHMFDTHSGNFSLLISNLTEKDEGLYVCWINENQHKSFSLTVKGKETMNLRETLQFVSLDCLFRIEKDFFFHCTIFIAWLKPDHSQ